jgi:hypothetical protein
MINLKLSNATAISSTLLFYFPYSLSLLRMIHSKVTK